MKTNFKKVLIAFVCCTTNFGIFANEIDVPQTSGFYTFTHDSNLDIYTWKNPFIFDGEVCSIESDINFYWSEEDKISNKKFEIVFNLDIGSGATVYNGYCNKRGDVIGGGYVVLSENYQLKCSGIRSCFINWHTFENKGSIFFEATQSYMRNWCDFVNCGVVKCCGLYTYIDNWNIIENKGKIFFEESDSFLVNCKYSVFKNSSEIILNGSLSRIVNEQFSDFENSGTLNLLGRNSYIAISAKYKNSGVLELSGEEASIIAFEKSSFQNISGGRIKLSGANSIICNLGEFVNELDSSFSSVRKMAFKDGVLLHPSSDGASEIKFQQGSRLIVDSSILCMCEMSEFQGNLEFINGGQKSNCVKSIEELCQTCGV